MLRSLARIVFVHSAVNAASRNLQVFLAVVLLAPCLVPTASAQQAPLFTFAQVSDSQPATEQHQQHFEEVVQALVDAGGPGALIPHPIGFLLFAGDLVDFGTDAEWQNFVQTMAPLAERGIPYLAVPGNHDRTGGGLALYEQYVANRATWSVESPAFVGHNGVAWSSGVEGLRVIGVNNANDGTVSAADLAAVGASITAAEAAEENVLVMAHIPHTDGGAPLQAWLGHEVVVGYLRGHIDTPFGAPGLLGVDNPNVWEFGTNSIKRDSAIVYFEAYPTELHAFVIQLSDDPTSLPAPFVMALPHPLVPPSGGDPSGSLTVTASQDAKITSGSSGTNYGAETDLRIRAGSTAWSSYVRFDVPSLGGAGVLAARLRLYVTDPSPSGGRVHPTASTWDEATLTWANAPAYGAPLDELGAVSNGAWAEFDVSPAVHGAGSVSFALTSADTNSVYYSSHEGAHPPELVLTLGGSGGADTTPPELTCPSDLTRESTSPAGALVTFAATATDDIDPSPTVVCVPASGSTFPLGTTTVQCTATDDAGNSSTGSFDVLVRDTTAPLVTCPANITVEGTGPAGALVAFAPSATDVCDPTPTLVSVPASGSTFPLGTTTVACTATDDAGNSSSCTFRVTVADTTAPQITCPAGLTAEGSGPEGSLVTFSASASDACDPLPELVCVPPSGSTFPLGTTTVHCTATDDSGNSATRTFDVTVQDTLPPLIACPADIVRRTVAPGGWIVDFAPTASDLCDPGPVLSCAPPSGSLFPVGTTLVTCTATDAGGNESSCSFHVTVRPKTRRSLGSVVVLPAPGVAPLTSAALRSAPDGEARTTEDLPLLGTEPIELELHAPAGASLLVFEVGGAAVELSDGITSELLYEPEAFDPTMPSDPTMLVFADVAGLFPAWTSETVLHLRCVSAHPRSRVGTPRFLGGLRLRNGSGTNEPVFASAESPRAGHAWQAWVDGSSHPHAKATLVLVGSRPLHAPSLELPGWTPSGEPLVALLPAGRLRPSLVPASGGLDVHTIPFPASALGRSFSLQAAILDERGPVLTNAIDLVIGP